LRSLTLPLLVAGIAAHDEDHSATADDFALVADSFDAGFDLHRGTRRGNDTGSHGKPCRNGGKRLSIRGPAQELQGLIQGVFKKQQPERQKEAAI
jgi:hypothetical protein